ncbi:MAG: transposase [Oscillospiraceae bacterium]|nr:transposase [Oscillospiraceae bacterium]
MRYSERCEIKRAAYQARIAEIPEESIVYVDECGIDEHLTRIYAKSPAGVPVYGDVRGRKFERTNIIAGKCGGKIVAPGEYKGFTDHKLFELWFCEALLKEVSTGSFIVLDNATFHRKKVLTALAENAGCSVIFLPPYSPDFNPIETEWANLKTFIRNYGSTFPSISLAIYLYFIVP